MPALEIIGRLEDWVWGLSLIGLTIAIHATGIVGLGLVGVRIGERLENQRLVLHHEVMYLIGIIGIGGLLLGTLHGFEATIWAAAYLWLGAFNSPADAMLYSIDSMTTRGASGLALPLRWRIVGALESADGMLLFGVSTAFMFAVMQARWEVVKSALRSSSSRRDL